jgi:hypothetical protein
MSVSSLFFKVEVEHDSEEPLEKIAAEICRQIQRVYGVRLAELSSFNRRDE